jgi:uncharacterized membrane protein required for colicin V production
LISSQLPNFQEALEFRSTSGIPIYLTSFQFWVFNIVSLLCDSVIIAIAVGIVSYFMKEIKVYLALLFGLLSRYLILNCLLLYFSGRLSLPDLTKKLDFGLCVLLTLGVLLTVCFSYLGLNYGKHAEYFDAKDKELYYLYGIPKKIWYLLFISYIPVIQFLSRLTIVQIYDFTQKITNMSFWKDTFSLSNFFSEDSARGITGLFGHIVVICFAWAIVIALFYFGLNAIRNKYTKHRWLKISCVFVLFPSTVTIIPIIRNRTWFF